ncbi:MAG: hypothetical protein IM575_01140, partial [Cytophagales bacterium]|nr:hypothetical protein [Cytophagales bacterium]
MRLRKRAIIEVQTLSDTLNYTLQTLKQNIKRFKEINEFFETTGFEKRTDIVDFFVFRFDELPKDSALKMPPYQ